MKIIRPVLFAALSLLCATSCKSQFEAVLAGPDVDAKYDMAFKMFNEGKYMKAGQLFESLSVISSGTSRDDTVQYYWGLSNYRFKDYYTAETNFETFVNNFPRSPFTESARYLRADCLYRGTYRWELDQLPTYKAITVISEYMLDYPDSPHYATCSRMVNELNERLDRKAFENARLYYKMEDYKASGVAFKNILKDDADNIFREDILYYAAMSSYKYANLSVAEKQQERFLIFVDDYYNFIGEFPDSGYRQELDRLFRKVKNIETSEQ